VCNIQSVKLQSISVDSRRIVLVHCADWISYH